MVEGLCRGLLRDAAEAEDALQQTFLLAYRSLVGGVEPREPTAWLATIARNECLARIRERTRRPVPVASADEERALPDSLAEAIRRADLAALWQAVSALPPQQRSALLMREFGGLRYDELAVALGVSEPAVESLLFRARRHLRAVLQPVYGASAAWDALARLLAGADPGAAVKVGAATVGVAVVAGGAVVVAPSSHRPRRPAPARAAVVPIRPAGLAVGGAARSAAAAQVRTSPPAPSRSAGQVRPHPDERRERESEHRSAERDERAVGARRPVTERSRDEERSDATAARPDGPEAEEPDETVVAASLAVAEQPVETDGGGGDGG